jgi:hypothetical protein
MRLGLARLVSTRLVTDRRSQFASGPRHDADAPADGGTTVGMEDRRALEVAAAAARRAASSASPSSAVEASALPGRARMTSNVPDGTPGSRAATRCCRRRRTRLRSTADPTRRPLTNPARAGSAIAGRLSQWTTNGPRADRRPRRATSSCSARVRTRARVGSMRDRTRRIRPTGRGGPWSDARRERLGRRECAYVAGNRGSWPVAGCSAGRCAYSRRLRNDSRTKNAGNGERTPLRRASQATPPEASRVGMQIAGGIRHFSG